jgi:hypothetical protein
MDKFTKQLLGTKTQQDVTPNGFNQPRSRFYNSTIRNYWKQGGALAPIIPHPYESKGTPIFRDTTDSSLFENGGELLAQPYPNSFFASDLGNYYADGGPLHDRDNTTGKLLNSTYASVLGNMFRDGGYFDRGYSLPEDSFRQGGRGLKDSIYASTSGQYPATYRQGGSILSMSNTPQLEGEGKDLNYPSKGYAYGSGGMLKRADGSYSQRGLWDNIRANKGSGKEPTKEMLRQERKIRNEKAFGGVITTSQLQQANYFALGGDPIKPKPRAKNYDPLYTIEPQVTESTAVRNLPKQDKKVVEKAIAKKTTERKAVAQKIQANPLLTQAQKDEILLDPRKLDENVNLAYEKGPDTIQQVEPQSTASRAWEYITNPLTAAEYAISGGGAENMPRNINEMRMAGIDPGVVAGRNLVGNTLNYTTNLFDAGDKVVRNLGEGNYGTAALEAMRFLPGARVSTGLGKQTAKYGQLSKLPDLEPLPKFDYKDINYNPTGRFSKYQKEIDRQAQNYVDLATSKENYERAIALDKEYGTEYVKALDNLKKHKEATGQNIGELPFNIKVLADDKSGAGGWSTFTPEGELKQLMSSQNIGPKPTIFDREIAVIDKTKIDDLKRVIPHELKHHYTLGQDLGFYENRYGDDLADMLDTPGEISRTNPAFADQLIQPAFKDKDISLFEYLEQPREIDAYINTNLRDELVEKNILKNHWDQLTEGKVADYLANSPNKYSQKYFDLFKNDGFIKMFNKGVYNLGIPAVGAGAASYLASPEDKTLQSTNYKSGGKMHNAPVLTTSMLLKRFK